MLLPGGETSREAIGIVSRALAWAPRDLSSSLVFVINCLCEFTQSLISLGLCFLRFPSRRSSFEETVGQSALRVSFEKITYYPSQDIGSGSKTEESITLQRFHSILHSLPFSSSPPSFVRKVRSLLDSREDKV